MLSNLFGAKSSKESRPRRASAIRKQQVLHQTTAYAADQWVETEDSELEDILLRRRCKQVDLNSQEESDSEKLSANQAAEGPSVSELLKKLAKTAHDSNLSENQFIQTGSALCPPPPLSNEKTNQKVSTRSNSKDYGVGLPPAACA